MRKRDTTTRDLRANPLYTLWGTGTWNAVEESGEAVQGRDGNGKLRIPTRGRRTFVATRAGSRP